MHRPVLYQEIIHAIQPKQGGIYIDCTLGSGGHAKGILRASSPDGQLIGFDVDPLALELAKVNLSEFGNRVTIIRASYSTLGEKLTSGGQDTVDGILLDLGVSSMQLDTPERGFSFRWDAPLDMRFDPENPLRAEDLVNNLPENELADLLYRYGEEHRSRMIARAIVKSRPIKTTQHLAREVARVTKARRDEIHPATLTFQALRIAVNRELESLKIVLPQALDALSPLGRVAIISFHSLEDRIVKQFFRDASRDCLCPPQQPVCTCGHNASIRLITRRPIQAAEAEIKENPRSRSARLRVAEKL